MGDIKLQWNVNSQPSRCDESLHIKIKYLTERDAFNWFILVVILVNSLFLALETYDNIECCYRTMLQTVDTLCLLIYSIEFLLKVYAEPVGYWVSLSNIFDFSIMTLSYLPLILGAFHVKGDSLSALKVLKALRTLRSLRAISFVKGLQVLVTALIQSVVKWVLNILLLLFLVMYLYAVVGYYLFGAPDDGDKSRWGNLASAMLSLVSFITCDGWTDLSNQLDIRGYEAGRPFIISFIFLANFVICNIFPGVICLNISEATEQYEQEELRERTAVLKHKKDFMMRRQHEDIQRMMEKQKKGNYTNFNDMVDEYKKSLRHTDCTMVTDLSTNILWMETLLRTLDHMDSTMYRIQQTHFEVATKLADVLEKKLSKRYGTHGKVIVH